MGSFTATSADDVQRHRRRHRRVDVEVVEEPLVVGPDDRRPPQHLDDRRDGPVHLPASDGAFVHADEDGEVRLADVARLAGQLEAASESFRSMQHVAHRSHIVRS